MMPTFLPFVVLCFATKIEQDEKKAFEANFAR